jgi:hypothetical protein
VQQRPGRRRMRDSSRGAALAGFVGLASGSSHSVLLCLRYHAGVGASGMDSRGPGECA